MSVSSRPVPFNRKVEIQSGKTTEVVLPDSLFGQGAVIVRIENPDGSPWRGYYRLSTCQADGTQLYGTSGKLETAGLFAARLQTERLTFAVAPDMDGPWQVILSDVPLGPGQVVQRNAIVLAPRDYTLRVIKPDGAPAVGVELGLLLGTRAPVSLGEVTGDGGIQCRLVPGSYSLWTAARKDESAPTMAGHESFHALYHARENGTLVQWPFTFPDAPPADGPLVIQLPADWDR